MNAPNISGSNRHKITDSEIIIQISPRCKPILANCQFCFPPFWAPTLLFDNFRHEPAMNFRSLWIPTKFPPVRAGRRQQSSHTTNMRGRRNICLFLWRQTVQTIAAPKGAAKTSISTIFRRAAGHPAAPWGRRSSLLW